MNPDEPKNPVKQNGAEPVCGYSTVPVWLVVMFGGAFYWGQLFLDQHAGGFNKDVYVPYQSYEEVFAANPQDPRAKFIAEGRKVFEATCAACHQLSGAGQEGKAPPLARSEWALAPGGNRIAHVVLNGLTGPITVKDKEWNLTMPPWRDNYTDYQIAAVLSYVRSQWGNNAGDVNPDLVKAARAETHPGPETSDELLRMPAQ